MHCNATDDAGLEQEIGDCNESLGLYTLQGSLRFDGSNLSLACPLSVSRFVPMFSLCVVAELRIGHKWRLGRSRPGDPWISRSKPYLIHEDRAKKSQYGDMDTYISISSMTNTCKSVRIG